MISATWQELKDFVDLRNLSVQYIESVDRYILFAQDGNLQLITVLKKSDPASADQTDFETNYKPSGNIPLRTQTLQGSTVVYSGTASSTSTSVPSTADKIISSFGLRNIGTTDILVSMDSGNTFFTVPKDGFFTWEVKGNIKQVVLKTLSGTSDYEIVTNFKEI